MPNRIKMKKRKTTTLASSGSALSNEPISFLILGTAFILFNGLRTLIVLNDFI
jgi:hypothetical protein